MASSVRLFSNHPHDKDTPYERTKYSEVNFRFSAGVGDRMDLTAEVKMVIAGSFNYYFTIDGRYN